MKYPSATYTFAMLLLGTLGIFLNESGLPPTTAVFFRSFIGGILLCIFCLITGLFRRENFSLKPVTLAIVSGLLMCVNWVAFFKALDAIGISTATVVFHIQPFIVLIFSSVILKERIGKSAYAWVMVGFLGLILACGGVSGVSLEWPYLIGIFYTSVAAAAYAGVTLITRTIQNLKPHLTSLIHCLVGAALTAAFVEIPSQGFSLSQEIWMLGLGFFPTALSYVLIYGSTPKMNTASIAVLTFIYPSTAVVFDFLVYGNTLGVVGLLGFFCIVISSLAVNLRWSFFSFMKG